MAITSNNLKRVCVWFCCCCYYYYYYWFLGGRGVAWVFWESDYFRIYKFVFVFSVHSKTRVDDQRSWRKVENFTLFLVSPSLLHAVTTQESALFSCLSDDKFYYLPRNSEASSTNSYLSLARQTSRESGVFLRFSLRCCCVFCHYIWLAQCKITHVILS